MLTIVRVNYIFIQPTPGRTNDLDILFIIWRWRHFFKYGQWNTAFLVSFIQLYNNKNNNNIFIPYK